MTTARVETVWRGAAKTHITFRYPWSGHGSPGSEETVALNGDHDGVDALCTEIEDRLNALVAGTPFSCAWVPASSLIQIESGAENFDLSVETPFGEFVGWNSGPYTNVGVINGDAYPPCRFDSLAPLPDPDPRYGVVRHCHVTDGGRVPGRLVDKHPIQPIALLYSEAETGQDWAHLAAWARTYLAHGSEFLLFRDATETDWYDRIWCSGTSVTDGVSRCVLTDESRDLVREWVGRVEQDGWLRLEARLKEGY